MNPQEINQKLIDAIIRKAEAVCPDSLALIGLYGSAATGDLHPKSDLDLLILINDEGGRALSDTFLLEEVGIGYDIYCTTWEMLEYSAQCNHPHLSKLLDAPLVYVRDEAAVARLEQLRQEAKNLLASDARFEKAAAALENAKKQFADCFLTDELPKIRAAAGGVIYWALDAVMLWHGAYFRKGVKRTFEELGNLPLPFSMEEAVMHVIRAASAEDIRSALTVLLRKLDAALPFPARKETPTAENLAGTYEESFSNWRNKMEEAAQNGDLFASFMNMAFFRNMLTEISQAVDVEVPEVMAGFDPDDPVKNLAAFDEALERYLDTYRQIGLEPRRFQTVDDFIAHYLKTE